MVHQYELYVKFILYDKKYDLYKFLNENHCDFWASAVDYFEYYADPPKEGIFVGKKYINIVEFNNCVDKFVPMLNERYFSKQIIHNIVKVYSMVLHPSSPDIFKGESIKILFRISTKSPDSLLPLFNSAYYFVIPFSRLSESDKDNGLGKYLALCESIPWIRSNTIHDNPETNAFEFLKLFFGFLNDKWMNSPSLYSRILLENGLIVLFRNQAMKHQLPVPDFGITQPKTGVIDLFLDFIQTFINKKNDLSLLIRIPFVFSFLLDVLTLNMNVCSIQHFFISISFCQEIISNKEVFHNIEKRFDHYIPGIFSLIIKGIESFPLDDIAGVIYDYLESMICCIIQSYPSEEWHYFKYFLNNEKDSLQMISFGILSLLKHYLYAGMSESIKIKFRQIITDNCLVADVLMLFSQYLAILSMPILYRIDVEQAKNECIRFVARRLRTKQVADCDWFADNFVEILNNPNVFVPNSISCIDCYLHHQSIRQMVVIPKLYIPQSEIITYVKLYLSIFEHDESSEYQKELPFFPYYSYHITLLGLRFMPTSIQKSENLLFFNSTEFFFSSLLYKSNNNIMEASLNILRIIFGDYYMKSSFTQTQIEKWYNILGLMLSYENESIRYSAAIDCINSIRMNYYGCIDLINPLLDFIENNIELCDLKIYSFLSFCPMFESKSKKILLNDCIPTKNIDSNINRSFELLEKCYKFNFEHHKERIQDIIWVYYFFIKHQFYNENPDTHIIFRSLNVLLNAIKLRFFESLLLMKSLLPYLMLFIIKFKDFFGVFLIELCKISLSVEELDDIKWTYFYFMVSFWAILQTNPINIDVETICCMHRAFEKYIISIENKMHRQQFDKIQKIFLLHFGNYNPCFHLMNSNSPEPTNYYPFRIQNEFLYLIGCIDCRQYIEMHDIVGGNRLYYSFVSPFSSNDPPQQVSLPLSEDRERIHSDFFQKINCVFNNIIEDSPFDMCLKEENETIINEFPESIGNQNHYFRPSLKYGNQYSFIQAFNILSNPKLESTDSDHIVNLNIESLKATSLRLQAKIAIVFVGKGIKTQNEILSTQIDDTSPQFQEFLSLIGSIVDLGDHIGYDAGLEKKPGRKSVYYCDIFNEVMFHVAPLIPNDPKDNQQVYKKRHIGNDHVTIVWNNSEREYDRQTITSQFNQVHIIITPLESNIFLVDTHWKKGIDWFGPLRSSSIIQKNILHIIVRETAICAQMIINNQTLFLSYPSYIRNQTFEKIDGLFHPNRPQKIISDNI